MSELAGVYRQRVLNIRETTKASVGRKLAAVDLMVPRPVLVDTLTDWVGSAALYVRAGQLAVVRISELYLLGQLAADGAERITMAQLGVATAPYIGSSYGQTVESALGTAAGRVLWSLDLHGDREVAQASGLAAAARAARVAVMSAARESLTAAMDAHPQVTGWTRVASQTACEACTALLGVVHRPAEPLRGHPSCSCVQSALTSP